MKIGSTLLLTQQGLCARFSTAAPFRTEVLTIPIDEPRGYLRSWDVRGDWRAEVPACTAIVDRPYATASAFPAWFVNIVDFGGAGPRAVTLDLTGYARVSESGQFSIELDRDMTATGRIGSAPVSSAGGQTISAPLDPGVPAPLRDVVGIALSKQPADRYPGAAAMAAAIEEAARAIG